MNTQNGSRSGGGSRAGITLASALLLLAASGAAAAQIPDEFGNLKILSKDISKGELIGVMRDFAGALGVRCNHCHVGPENLQGMDFAADEKRAKRTARIMMKMVDAINQEHLAGIDTKRSTKVRVTCQTCHRRLTVPEPIEDVIAREIEADGMDAATEEYRSLREEHYGGAAYDFSQVPLNSLAERLLRSKKTDEALRIVAVNLEYHPEDTWTHMLMAGIHKARGDREQAIAWYRKALALDPGNGHIKKQIEALEGGGEE